MTTAFAENALSWGTAQGGTTDAQDGTAGPTIIGIAEQANSAGSAFGPHGGVTVRPATATALAAVGVGQVSALSVRKLLHAGIPSMRSPSHANTPVLRPVHAYS